MKAELLPAPSPCSGRVVQSGDLDSRTRHFCRLGRLDIAPFRCRGSNLAVFGAKETLSHARQSRIYQYTAFCNGPDEVKSS